MLFFAKKSIFKRFEISFSERTTTQESRMKPKLTLAQRYKQLRRKDLDFGVTKFFIVF